MDLPIITICVPVWNRMFCLERFLNSMVSLEYPKDKLAIVFVDNLSTDGTLETLYKFKAEHGKDYKYIRVISQKSNDPEARNIAIGNSIGEYLLFWDTDVICNQPNKLLSLINYLIQNPTVYAVGTSVYSNPEQPTIYERINYGRCDKDNISVSERFPLPFALFRKEVFEKVGRFLVDTPTTCDVEIAERMRLSGMKMATDATTHFPHTKKASSTSTGLKSYWHYLVRHYHDGIDVQCDILMSMRPLRIAHLIFYAVFPMILALSILTSWVVIVSYFAILLGYQLVKFRGRKIAFLVVIYNFLPSLILYYSYLLSHSLGLERKVDDKRYGYTDHRG